MVYVVPQKVNLVLVLGPRAPIFFLLGVYFYCEASSWCLMVLLWEWSVLRGFTVSGIEEDQCI